MLRELANVLKTSDEKIIQLQNLEYMIQIPCSTSYLKSSAVKLGLLQKHGPKKGGLRFLET